MSVRRLIFAIAFTLSSLVAASPAQAACGAVLNLCTCTVSTSGIDFGTYNPVAGTDNDSSGTIRVRCLMVVALAGSYTIEVGRGGSTTFTPRKLANGAATLNYNLYTTNAHSQIWGDGSAGTQSVTNNFAALLSVDQTTAIYGRVPAGQNVVAGPYTDAIIVTVIF